MHPIRQTLAMILFALVMVAAGCASSDGDTATVAVDAASEETSSAPTDETSDEDAASSDEEPADESSDDQDTDDQADSSDVADGGDDTPMAQNSPIGQFFSDDGGLEAALEEFNVKVEEEIVICMAGQGFEFKPSGGAIESEVMEAQNELSELAWTTEYGYGISTSFDSFAQQQAADPNGEIIFSMGEAERELWFETLLGVGYDDPERFEEGPPALEEQGCIGEALINAGGQDVIEGLESVGEEYETASDAIFDRDEMIVAVGEWSVCLSEDGYPGYAEAEDPRDDVEERFEAIVAPIEAAFDELPEEEIRAFIAGDSVEIAEIPGLDVDALRALQDEERALALADLGCYDTHVRATYEPLRDELELGLLDQYADEFNALRTIGE